MPAKANVTARTANGGISMSNVSGTLGFDAVNGGVTLSRVSGDVKGKTVNGGVNVELDGEHWEGAGLDARTTNGGVSVKVPDGYSCQLAVTTVNGGVRSDFRSRCRVGWTRTSTSRSAPVARPSGSPPPTAAST